jgi:hypothetical protein
MTGVSHIFLHSTTILQLELREILDAEIQAPPASEVQAQR